VSDFLETQRVLARSPGLQRTLRGPTTAETADAIVSALDRATGLGLDQDLRHLSGQVARQARLPRDPGRDHRFLTHLEWALRDLAIRPFEPSPRNDRSRP
jgi:hypothetical protein